MPTFRWTDEPLITILSTELDGLPNDSFSAASLPIGNADGAAQYIALELTLAAPPSPRASGGWIGVALVLSLDGGVTFPDYADPTLADWLTRWTLDPTASARRLTRSMIPIPLGVFRVAFYNATGAPLAAAGNLLRGARLFQRFA